MILRKDGQVVEEGDVIYYGSTPCNVTLITESYILIRGKQQIKIAYDSNGYPYKVENEIDKSKRILMDDLNKLGWRVD